MTPVRILLRLQALGQVGSPASWLQSSLRENAQPQVLRQFHSSPACAERSSVPAAEPLDEDKQKQKKKKKKNGSDVDLFDRVAGEFKTKATFTKAIDLYVKSDVRRRGHVEFIYAALKKMPEFGVERDLAVYNSLLDIFPKEVFVPRNFIQRMFNHYPRQQQCGVQLLEQMESYGIMPNVETKVLLAQIFGAKGHPMRKFQRILYWFPRFKHVNPFPVPQELPADPVDLARFSLTRIANDLDAEVTVYQHPRADVAESGEPVTLPHIVGIQSPNQMELLAKHDPARPVFVEGPFPLWLRRKCVHYYILRADPTPHHEEDECPYDPESCLDYPRVLDLDLDRDLGDDEAFDVETCDEGPVFAMCMTDRGDEATLNHWISGLQQKNAILGQVPTLFLLKAGTRDLQSWPDRVPGAQDGQDEDTQAEEGPSKQEASG